MKYIYEKIKPSKPVLSEFAREQHLKETGQHSSDEEILAYREQSTMNYSTPPKWMNTNKLDDVKVKVKLTKKEITTHYHKLLDEVTNDAGELRQSIEDTLIQRGKRYGEFKNHADLSQRFKKMFDNHVKEFGQPENFTNTMSEAIEMIFHKIARIANGSPDYVDSWVDICGYSQLVVDEYKKDFK